MALLTKIHYSGHALIAVTKTLLISDSNQFIFVHIRKAAGSSMLDVLHPYALPKPTTMAARLRSRARLEWNYKKYRFRQHEGIMAARRRMPKHAFNSYFKFAFVRNPWDRLVSEYEFILKRATHGRHNKVIKLDSFTDFIRMQSQRQDAYQINMLCDKNGQLMMDFVGRFENLNQDWDKVCKLANIPLQALTHTNQTKHRDFRDYYDQQSIKLVADYWADEIKLFGYSFNNEKEG